MVVAGFMLTPAALSAQEFPIAVGRDTTFAGGGAFDGTNWLVSIMGDTLSQYNITAQLISPTGSLVGTRIAVGGSGTLPVATVAFDGSNYLLVWRENTGNLKGRFIDPSGNLVGASFTIATNSSTEFTGSYGITFGDTTYLVVFVKSNNNLYGQWVNKTGQLVGNQIQISGNAVEVAIAFDGSNYLVAWQNLMGGTPERHDVYGRIVSQSGSVTGSFVISQNPSSSYNPLDVAFDGTNYFVVWNRDIGPGYPSPTIWDIYGRVVSPSGSMGDHEFPITTAEGSQIMPALAYNGTRYLATWTDLKLGVLEGGFFSAAGVPIDTSFVIFDTLNNKIPVGGCGYGGNKFLVVATRGDNNYTNGDVYGRFLDLPVGIEDNNNRKPEKCALFEHYLNPFDPGTPIAFSLPRAGYVTLKIYTALGEEVATLVAQELPAGRHEVKWHARGIPNGTYFCRLQAGAMSETRKLVLLR